MYPIYITGPGYYHEDDEDLRDQFGLRITSVMEVKEIRLEVKQHLKYASNSVLYFQSYLISRRFHQTLPNLGLILGLRTLRPIKNLLVVVKLIYSIS